MGKFTDFMSAVGEQATIGLVKPKMVRPHCNVTGQVYTKTVKSKRGVSGGKATGALMTGGLSLLATGLSQKVKTTQATCKNCTVAWMI